MASVRAINVPGLGEVALGDWIDDHLWGTAKIGTTQSSDVQVFTSGRGQQRPGDTITNTDFDVYVPEPGRMPTGWEMLVFSVRVDLVGPSSASGTTNSGIVAVADAQNLLANTLHEFWILGKVYSQGPVGFYPAGGGPTGTGNNITTNGVAALGASKQFLVPHKIGSGEAFFSKLRYPIPASLTAAQLLRVVLSGLLKRSVQ